MRPLPARAAAERRAPQRQQHRGGGAGRLRGPREPWAAIGARAAAELYGGTVLEEGIEDEAANVTRFVWIAPAGAEPRGGGAWKTSLVFAELGEDHPGALVDALREFSSREVNLTRIESRPLRLGLGRYMFFCDLEGAVADDAVAEAIEALRGKAESVRVLGSYPSAEEPARIDGRVRPRHPRRISVRHGTRTRAQRDV